MKKINSDATHLTFHLHFYSRILHLDQTNTASLSRRPEWLDEMSGKFSLPFGEAAY